MDIKEKLTGKSAKRHPWELARLEFIKYKLKIIINQKSTKRINILDFGCGDTFVSLELSKIFIDATFFCIDNAFNDEMIQHLSKDFQKKQIHLYNNNNQINIPNNGKIDIVLLLDVLEHINDNDILSYFKSLNLIDTKTTFLITVPAFQSLFCSHDNFLGHLRRYNNTNLKNTLIKNDYKINSLGYFFTLLLIPRIYQTLIEKVINIKHKNQIGNWNKNIAITWFIKTFLIWDMRITEFLLRLKIKLPGLSNYTICQLRA